MRVFVKGSFDHAFKLASNWQEKTDGKILRMEKKNWHGQHPIDGEKIAYIIGPNADHVDCSKCMQFIFGHEPIEGQMAISVDLEERKWTFDDFIKNYRDIGDKERDGIYGQMLKNHIIPSKIIASYLWVQYGNHFNTEDERIFLLEDSIL